MPQQSLESRLFRWLLALTLTPALALLLLGTWFWQRSLAWFGGLGPWQRVAESGRSVLQSAEPAARSDPALASALAIHRQELAASLLQAERWTFLAERIEAFLYLLALVSAVVLAVLALVASRGLARGLASPIADLVDWAGRLAREEPLPPAAPAERREVVEVQSLRSALRRASADLAEARSRALESERVRAWGELARRVAHEMKNPLTPLRLAARRLGAAVADDAALREPVGVIEEETRRLEEMARQFAALGRPPEGPTSEVDLPELLAGLLETDIPPTVESRLDTQPDVPMVEGHYEGLLRAFRNVLRNAVEASPSRVQVTVRRAPAPHATGGREWVEVAIRDAGPGIPLGLEERIWEPDFTTKSRGTGLGLALVRQAILEDGGEVSVRNLPEGGAEFVLRLPPGGASS